MELEEAMLPEGSVINQKRNKFSLQACQKLLKGKSIPKLGCIGLTLLANTKY